MHEVEIDAIRMIVVVLVAFDLGLLDEAEHRPCDVAHAGMFGHKIFAVFAGQLVLVEEGAEYPADAVERSFLSASLNVTRSTYAAGWPS